MRKPVISDDTWVWLEPLLPDPTPHRGGRWRDHREVLETIVWRYRTESPWQDLPAELGPWQSVYHRHVRWSRDGTCDRVFAAAHTAADTAGDLDWLVAADSSLMRVHQHGATARRRSGNAATVSIGHGCQPDGSCDVEGQVAKTAEEIPDRGPWQA